MATDASSSLSLRALLGVSVALLGVHLYAASHLGFGDSEALYAAWAAHPQPAYLDHPGLIGVVGKLIGGGLIPTANRAHIVTSNLGFVIPFMLFGIARLAGATAKHAATAALIVAVVPEIAVGLFALTPDLLLAPLWLGSLGLAMFGMAPNTSDTKRSAALVAAGLGAGVASSAKVSGVLLMIALAVTYATTKKARGSLWAWAGLLAGVVVLLPIVRYEAHFGFPMLRHRLIDTQQAAGASRVVTNLGALVGGQLAYLSPLVAWLAIVVGRDLFRHRNDDAASRVLFLSFAVPLLPLALLCLWSPVAEPHWIAPPLLALPIHAARRGGDATLFAIKTPARVRKIVVGAVALAATFTLAAHVWVLVPSVSVALMPATTDPKLDISTELYGWPQTIEAIKDEMAHAGGTGFDPQGKEIVLVGPHWTVCAQLEAGLHDTGVRVGCATPIKDDFDNWLARDVWRKTETVLFVTDNRYNGDGAEQLPEHVRLGQQRVSIMRGGRVARVFQLYLYGHRENALR